VSNAAALSAAVLVHAPQPAHADDAAPARPNDSKGASAGALPARDYVYGDSTPFPYTVDFVDIVRGVVRCAVSLMQAQHLIDCRRIDIGDGRARMARLEAELKVLAEAVRRSALATENARLGETRALGERIAATAQIAVDLEAKRSRERVDATVARAETDIVGARLQGADALGQLLARHDIPGASCGFRLVASGPGYAAEALVTLPCGVRSTFRASLPEGHSWQTLRRVRDVRRGVAVTLRRQIGWFTKRVEPLPVRLDGLTILGASVDASRGALLLGKSERAGAEHAFDIDFDASVPCARWHDAGERASLDLRPDDARTVIGLLRGIERETRDLLARRGALTDATVDDTPVAAVDPNEVCGRIVALVASTARELARRSGAPGELVLRRNMGAGHRDEVFVTIAELLEQIETLPPPLRRVFAQLELEGRPRSPRAPARSLPSYEEVSAAELLPTGATR
jgi:hypothetical protein